MSHRVLITGASGYLGGTLLARLSSANLPPYEKLYALVRTDVQAEAVKQYGAEPLSFNAKDPNEIRNSIVANRITVVFFLIDATGWETSKQFIQALAEVKKQTGQVVHFLHTTGAKIFADMAGAPTDRPLLDTESNLYDIQKAQKAVHPGLQAAVKANNVTVEEGEKHGVRSYVFAPCIVYGPGEGFGNKISIQTVAIVKAAKAAGRVYRVNEGRPTWPVCHIIDNTTLYIEMLRHILAGDDLDHGKNGYYLASSGSVAWDDLYDAMAIALKKRGVIADETVLLADQAALEKIAPAIEFPPEFVFIAIGGKCTFTAKHGEKFGWKPQYAPEHALEAADEEVELILANL